MKSRSGRRRRVLAGGLAIALIAALTACGGSSSENSGGVTSSGDSAIQQIPIDERETVEDFDGELLDGSHFRLGYLEGKVGVFNVWGSWCGPCRAEAPDLREVALEYKSKGVAFVGLNTRDSDAAAKAFERKFKVPYDSITTEDSGRVVLSFAGQISVGAVPTTVVLDRQSRVAARVLGVVSAATLRALLDDVLAEPAPAA